MERKYLPSLSCLAFAVGLFLPVFIHAQDPADVPRDPSDWSAFVNGGDNPVMCDTFRMQTFRQLPEDNWPYELPDEATIIVNSDEPKLKGHYGSHSLKIPIKTRVDFAHFDLGIYQNAIIIPHFTCMYFPDDGILWAKTFRTNKADEAAIFTQSDVKDNLKELSFRSLTVSEMYPGISFFGTTESMQTSQSYYYIDSLYAYGDIPRYSLFTGQGGWNDTIRWSHLPTARRRSALIQGEATIDRPESADRILIGDGGLNLTCRKRGNGISSPCLSISISQGLTPIGHWETARQPEQAIIFTWRNMMATTDRSPNRPRATGESWIILEATPC